MAPKVRSANQEVSLGTSADDGKIVFGVAQYVSTQLKGHVERLALMDIVASQRMQAFDSVATLACRGDQRLTMQHLRQLQRYLCSHH